MGTTLLSMLASLPATSKFIVAVFLVGTWHGNVSSTSVEGGVTEATLLPVSAPARNEAIAFEGWTTLILVGGTKRQTVMVRNDADETEVQLYCCILLVLNRVARREPGLTDARRSVAFSPM